MQLQVNQPDLSQMFGQDSLYSTLYGLQRQDQATANQNQNLGQAQQDQSFQADMHPLDMSLAQANIGHTNALANNAIAQNPGMIADSATKTRVDADQSQVPEAIRRQAMISKAAAGTTEDDLKKHVAQATMDLTANLPNGMPDIAKRRDAQLVISTAPEIVNELRKVQAQNSGNLAVAQEHSRGALEVAKASAEARERLVGIKAEKMPSTSNYQAMDNWATRKALAFEMEGDDATAAKYRAVAATARQKSYEDKSAAGNTGNLAKPDLGALDIQTIQPPGITGGNDVTATTPPSTPLTGQKTTVYKADGTPVSIDSGGLNHLPPGWSRTPKGK